MEHWIAGILATLREFTLLYAPNINSYKRFAKGSFAPDRHRVGRRQPHLRAAGGRARLSRCGSRTGCPAATSTRTSAIAAIIAGGLHGIENELPLPDPLTGNAYTSGVDQLPTTLREAAQLFAESAIARAAFGDEMVDHYLNQARIEVEAYDAAVTDWERVRGFERL